MPNSFKIMQVSVLSILSVFFLFSIIPFPLNQNQHANSQTFKTNSTATSTADANSGKGVDLTNIHTSPSNVKVYSKVEIISTVVNNSPNIITFSAGVCDSPLSAKFLKKVVIRHTQGCTSSSPPFQLKSGDQVTIAGPSSGTIYQAFAAGQTTASATLYYQTANSQAANVTKPFVFTISP